MDLKRGIRVATINVRGLASRRRQYQLSRLCVENELDIIAIQETKVESEEQTNKMETPFRTYYNICTCHAIGTSGGCAVLVRRGIGINEDMVTVSESGRFIVLDFSFNGSQWRIICVYAPNDINERCRFFSNLEEYLRCDKYIIFLGDFNCVCHAEDRAKRKFPQDKSAVILNTLVNDYYLEDVGRLLAGTLQPQFTHYQRDSQADLTELTSR